MDGLKIQATPQKLTLNCRGKLISLHKPVVMGIVNTTPDSFFESSRANNTKVLLQQVEQMLNEGATFIDMGGYSTRPGAQDISIDEEVMRVVPAISEVIKRFPEVLISVDTFRAKVATEAVNAGAVLVNDISSGDDDPNMLDAVAHLHVPYAMMHKRGTPQTMQQFAHYENVTADVLSYFTQKIAVAKQTGITDLIIDPGFGFAKTLEHNYQLLRELEAFKVLGLPILVGVSRKKMIQAITHTDATGALNGTSVVNTIALLKGAHILRVHDVKEAVECINIVNTTHGIS